MKKTIVKTPDREEVEFEFYNESEFRDNIGTVDEQGKRKWIYPKKPSGKLHNARAWVSGLLLSLLFIGPFLKLNGQPMFLFNILERKFILFGVTFWPQDFHLFVLVMLSFFVFVVLFTVIFGRIWCGWACPQTIFMEMVFRKIEYWIEGDAHKQRKLTAAPWNTEKIMKRGLKLGIFFAISFLIANLVMAYIVGIDALSSIVTQPPAENWGKFTGVAIFSGIFFFVFAYFREQACIAVCPYGRLQGVFLGKDSIVVAYDWLRGEPRQRLKKKETRSGGSCIDCKLCVQVCPTGIDIRNGTQMECVNCTACIDVCDEVMDKVGFEKGLIRYDSYNGIAQGKRFTFTPRILAYSVVLLLLLSTFFVLFLGRNEVETTILRTPGKLYQELDNDRITNLYNVQIVNKTLNVYPVSLKLLSPEGGKITVVGAELEVPKQDIAKGVFFLELPKSELDGVTTPVRIGIYSGDEQIDEVESAFLGPLP